ncbi:MAG: glycoside hydrolase family 88 protein [Bacteroidota bacterium]
MKTPLKTLLKALMLSVLFVTFNFQLSAQKFVKSRPVKGSGMHSEAYQSFTFNGVWCWLSDPRAVYYEGEHRRTYAGWIDNFGDVHVGYYDHDSRQTISRTIFNDLEIDDHDNPSILIDEEGHLLLFFSPHTGPEGLYFIRAKRPEDVSQWHEGKLLKLNDPALLALGSESYTYTNPVKLSEEDGRIFLFWRGIDGKPTYATSENNGATWSEGEIFCMPERTYPFRRPYVKISSNGMDKIHIALTDGHPRNEPENSIYYMYYQDGAFYRANGDLIRKEGTEPHQPRDMDVVYDATLTKEKAWIWDIAEDQQGNPALVYARFPDDQSHLYSYARWDGEEWIKHTLVNSGGWFPETPEGKTEPEPNYSGGIVLDHEDPSVLYLSVNRDSVFEIEQWKTINGGKSWRVEAITRGSSKDNIRPFAVRGAGEGNPLQLLWMQNTKYLHYASPGIQKRRNDQAFGNRFHASIKMGIPSPRATDPLSSEGIMELMHRVADWQLANPLPGRSFRRNHLDWLYGAFYTGLMRLYQETGEQRYADEMINVGDQADWELLDDIFHADRLTIVDVWADLYEERGDPKYIDKARWAMDIHLARKYKALTDVRFEENPARLEWWSWCDALYMAPPSFISMSKVTGNPKYLEYADTQWWKTSDYLYSKDDSLYYRDDRFFDQRSENGKKIFWARGNGWVIAGLSRLLEDMPSDYKNREKFEQQYREMAQKLLSLQDEDGLWRVSLIDPEYLNMGESSGSSFFTFALAWGINNGLLDASHKPAVERAWKALTQNVNEWGRLGYVQQVAGSPYPFYDHQWQVYATGAFLLAGCEMLELAD